MGLFQIPHSANSRVPKTCGSTWLPPTSSRGGRLTRTTGDNQSLLQVRLKFFFNIESSTTEDNNIFCYFFSLHPSNCETSTTGDNQSLLQVQLKLFGLVNQAQLRTTIIFSFFYIQPIVKLAQLATTRACFKPSL